MSKRVYEGNGIYIDEIFEHEEPKVKSKHEKKDETIKAEKAGWVCQGCGEWLAPPETPMEIVNKILTEHNKKKHSGGIIVE